MKIHIKIVCLIALFIPYCSYATCLTETEQQQATIDRLIVAAENAKDDKEELTNTLAKIDRAGKDLLKLENKQIQQLEKSAPGIREYIATTNQKIATLRVTQASQPHKKEISQDKFNAIIEAKNVEIQKLQNELSARQLQEQKNGKKENNKEPIQKKNVRILATPQVRLISKRSNQ